MIPLFPYETVMSEGCWANPYTKAVTPDLYNLRYIANRCQAALDAFNVEMEAREINNVFELLDSKNLEEKLVNAMTNATPQVFERARDFALALVVKKPSSRFGWFKVQRTHYDHAAGKRVVGSGASRSKMGVVSRFSNEIVDCYLPTDDYRDTVLRTIARGHWVESRNKIAQRIFEVTGYEVSELVDVDSYNRAMKNASSDKWVYTALHAMLTAHESILEGKATTTVTGKEKES